LSQSILSAAVLRVISAVLLYYWSRPSYYSLWLF